ncbi:FeoA family protein [Candidatus Borrarchaeum sp.]|uniref:FeoA family protein n=1 Tax=Candidatus Borrarchaeum sp. TaxID=2846742 RepID=UPI002581048D|nr:FeoA family protein [Candidatus Borrarchaeum sp.]
MTEQTLNKLKPGEKCIVKAVKGKGPVSRRIRDMGIVPGTKIEVIKVAPLGDPVQFLLKGYHLTLRNAEAKNVFVEVI